MHKKKKKSTYNSAGLKSVKEAAINICTLHLPEPTRVHLYNQSFTVQHVKDKLFRSAYCPDPSGPFPATSLIHIEALSSIVEPVLLQTDKQEGLYNNLL